MKHPYDHFIVEAILDLAQARQWLSIIINHYLSFEWLLFYVSSRCNIYFIQVNMSTKQQAKTIKN